MHYSYSFDQAQNQWLQILHKVWDSVIYFSLPSLPSSILEVPSSLGVWQIYRYKPEGGWLSPTPLPFLTVAFFPSSHLQGALFILLFKVKCFSPCLSPDAKRLKPRYNPHMQCLLGCNSQWKMPPHQQESPWAFYLSQYATSPPPPPCFHFQLHVISFQLFNLILSALFFKNLLFHPKALEGKETHTF